MKHVLHPPVCVVINLIGESACGVIAIRLASVRLAMYAIKRYARRGSRLANLASLFVVGVDGSCLRFSWSSLKRAKQRTLNLRQVTVMVIFVLRPQVVPIIRLMVVDVLGTD